MDESWSRTDQKRKNRVAEATLERLAKDIVRLPETKLEKLELTEDLFDAVLGFQRITSAPARNRQLRLVRGLLRNTDWATIEARMRSAATHGSAAQGTANAAAARLEASWMLRLLGEGNVGLDAFLAEFPQADRTHLRQLMRTAGKATHERRVKAEERLRTALRSFLR